MGNDTQLSPPGAAKGIPKRLIKTVADRQRPRHMHKPLHGMLDDLLAGFSEQVAIVDENWIILSTNRAWSQMLNIAGYPELVPGTNYLDFLETFASRGHENASLVLRGVQGIAKGLSDSFEFTYAGVDAWEGRTLQLRIHRLCIEGHVVATIARHDVTDSVELHRVRQDCTAAILKSETEARQRLTRELHDSTAQLLTSIGLLLTTMKVKRMSSEPPGVIDEALGLLSQATQEIRSMAYLAHAPDVREIGLVQALDGLATGFGRRAGLDISFLVDGERTLLPVALETALYRIAQEAISNVYRHAGAKHSRILLAFRSSAVHLVIADDGIGVSDETLSGRRALGVGLSGMRSRLPEIGGRLTVRRLNPGTAIIASLPRV